MKTIQPLLACLAVALLIPGEVSLCDPLDPVPNAAEPLEERDLLDQLAGNPEFSLFTAAVEAAGVAPSLRLPGPWTLFVPSNDAFRALPEGTLSEWSKPENRGQFAGMVRNHVIRGRLMSAEMVTTEVRTLSGEPLAITVGDEAIGVGTGRILKSDMTATNGVIHVINVVIRPSDE